MEVVDVDLVSFESGSLPDVFLEISGWADEWANPAVFLIAGAFSYEYNLCVRRTLCRNEVRHGLIFRSFIDHDQQLHVVDNQEVFFALDTPYSAAFDVIA